MRTTVDLPPGTYAQVRQLAAQRAQSVSSVVAELTAVGLSQLGVPLVIHHDAETGLPYVHISRPITSDEVIEAIKDDE